MVTKPLLTGFVTTFYIGIKVTIKVEKQNNSPTVKMDEWRCPECGKINKNYVGTCSCGVDKSVGR